MCLIYVEIFCLIRSARKAIEDEVKRRLPRKPWMEVKCPPELRELVYRSRKPRKNKDKSPTRPSTKPDHIVSDGKATSSIKNELKVPEVGTPRIDVNDEKPPIISQGLVPPGSIGVQSGEAEDVGKPVDKAAVSPAAGGTVLASGAGLAGGAVDAGTHGKVGGIGGTNVDEPIVIDD